MNPMVQEHGDEGHERPHEPRRDTGPAAPISLVVGMPWRVRLHAARLIMAPLFRIRFALAGVRWGPGWRIFGTPIIQRHRGSAISIGARLSLRSAVRSNPLGPSHPVILSTRSPRALISIGDDFGMTGGSIVAASRIVIGDRVLVGANCVIADNDFHPLPVDQRRVTMKAAVDPISIGDDVFIGMNTIILKGVSIGARSVIGAGSVVAADVPADVISAGNPARVIRSLDS